MKNTNPYLLKMLCPRKSLNLDSDCLLAKSCQIRKFHLTNKTYKIFWTCNLC